MTRLMLALCLVGAVAWPASASGPSCPVAEAPARAMIDLPDGTTVVAMDGALVVGDATWTTCDGLPGPFPTSVARFGGAVAVGFRAAGLHLFDGEGFTAVPGLPRDAVRALATDEATASLWIGTGRSGLWRLDFGTGAVQVEPHRILGQREISALHVTSSGTLHVGAGLYGWWRRAPTGRVRRLERGIYVGCFGQDRGRVLPLAPGPRCSIAAAGPGSGLPSAHITALAVHRGQLVVGTFDEGIVTLVTAGTAPSGRFVPLDGSPRLVNALLSDGEALWIATPKGLYRADGGAPARRLALGLPSEHVNGLARGLDGTVWVATGRGLAGITHAGAVRIIDQRAGLPSRIVYSVAVTDDGAVWAGTAGGAARLDAEGLTLYTQASGALTHDWVNALMPDGDSVLAGTYDAGVVRLLPEGDGHVEAGLDELWVNPGGLLRLGEDLAVATLGDGLVLSGGAELGMVRGLPSDDVTTAVMFAGQLWVGTRGGLYADDA